MNKLLIFSCLLASVFAHGKQPWPASAKDSYANRCASELASQGLKKPIARLYCSCIADGMESEFGMEEYSLMMSASPNPKGSGADRRLFVVFQNCQKHL